MTRQISRQVGLECRRNVLESARVICHGRPRDRTVSGHRLEREQARRRRAHPAAHDLGAKTPKPQKIE